MRNSEKVPIVSVRNWVSSVDLAVMGACDLACEFCYGPEHDTRGFISSDTWRRVIDFFQNRGTTSVVFTGGEPTLRKDLPELVTYAKNSGLRVTLSTNGIRLANKWDIDRLDRLLDHVDDLGIPLDTASSSRNPSMRKVTRITLGDQFNAFFSVLSLITNRYPNIETTGRTVVSAANIDQISQIGAIMDGRREVEEIDRWKLYEFVPKGYGAEHAAQFTLPQGTFRRLATELPGRHPYLRMQFHYADAQSGRYLHIYPNGDLRASISDTEHRVLGNFKTDSWKDIEQAIKLHIDTFGMDQNLQHAQH